MDGEVVALPVLCVEMEEDVLRTESRPDPVEGPASDPFLDGGANIAQRGADRYTDSEILGVVEEGDDGDLGVGHGKLAVGQKGYLLYACIMTQHEFDYPNRRPACCEII